MKANLHWAYQSSLSSHAHVSHAHVMTADFARA